jgi:hypothetical protein
VVADGRLGVAALATKVAEENAPPCGGKTKVGNKNGAE